VIVVLHFREPERGHSREPEPRHSREPEQGHSREPEQRDVSDYLDRLRALLGALAEGRGWQRGSIGRAADDERAWALVTEWDTVGSYRRALGSYQVKMIGTPLMADVLDIPGAFEVLVSASPEAGETVQLSDRAADADWGPRNT
jgi:hypothetical protein